MHNENILGTEPITKLIWKFGLPSMVSMLVNSIYNLVDQIFIGQGVGMLGNGATNVTMPFVIIALALNIMISAGTAANVGLSLGRKEQDRADKTLANGFSLSIITGFGVLIFGELLLTPLLTLFGATEAIMPYAKDYASLYLIGMPITAVGMMVQEEVRTDGSPRYAMVTMLVGAVINIILDPIFIFVFHWGVKGAAIATVIGQLATMILVLEYLFRRMKTLTFSAKNMKLEGKIAGSILSLGVSAFLSQFSMLIMQIVMNNQSKKYGAASIYGEDIPLVVFGIVMRVNSLMMSLLIGLVSGTAPVFSYNYGAEKFRRIKELAVKSLLICITIGLAGFACFQLFPQQIISIFGQEDELYNTFAITALKNMTILIFIMAVQMVATTYFQATGKPIKAMLIALSRQFLFSIPALLVLPILFTKLQGPENGILGVMYSFPAADLLSVFLCGIMLLVEMKHLNEMIRSQERLPG